MCADCQMSVCARHPTCNAVLSQKPLENQVLFVYSQNMQWPMQKFPLWEVLTKFSPVESFWPERVLRHGLNTALRSYFCAQEAEL